MSEKILRLMGRLPGNAPSVSHDSAVKAEKPVAPAAPSDVQDKKRIRKAALLKLGAMCVFLGVAVVFMTISWFTMSREVENKGIQMSAGGQVFELEVESGSEAFAPLYNLLSAQLQPAGSNVLATTSDYKRIYWRMEDEDNMLMPGAQGALHFKVTNTSNPETVKYSLDVHGFTAETETVETINPTTNKREKTTNVTAFNEILSSSEAENKEGLGFLKKHLMYFTGRTGSAESGYRYFGLITDLNSFSLSPDAGKTNEFTIYWIWPRTFGQIALSGAEGDSDYIESATPLLAASAESSERSLITAYITEKVSGSYTFFNGAEAYDVLLGTLYTKRAASQSYAGEYQSLSEGYNAADQSIGKYVDYALIELTANG